MIDVQRFGRFSRLLVSGWLLLALLLGGMLPQEAAASTQGVFCQVPGNPNFVVKGTITRTDKQPTPGGYVERVVPVKYVPVVAWEADPIWDDYLGAGYTDENGTYEIEVCETGDGFLGGNLEFYVEVVASVEVNPDQGKGELDALHDAVTNSTGLGLLDDDRYREVYRYHSSVQEDLDPGAGPNQVRFDIPLEAKAEKWSAIFNIVENWAGARRFIKGTGNDTYGVVVNGVWKPGGYERTRSSSAIKEELWDDLVLTTAVDILIEGDDPWNDSLILGEWAYFYQKWAKESCLDLENPPNRLARYPAADKESAWSWGWSIYLQSAIRQSMGEAYSEYWLDMSGNTFNLESDPSAATRSDKNEVAIAAALWDIADTPEDGQDRVAYGHDPIVDLFSSVEFAAKEGIECSFGTFMGAWEFSGRSLDDELAAAVNQNVIDALDGAAVSSQALNVTLDGALPGAADATPAGGGDAWEWWNKTLFLVDNSPSMAPNLDDLKPVLRWQVDKGAGEPQGTEFNLLTFHEGNKGEPATLFDGQFFPESVSFDGLQGGGSDNGCTVGAFRALAAAVDGQQDANVWLYTDGEANPSSYPNVETVKRLLTENNLRGSFVLLGQCGGLNAAEQVDPALQQAARTFVGPAAAEVAGGIVPYLATAISSGGQFLYVDPGQLADPSDLGDVLLAQLTHSAGAGRWSDYVSDQATYRWDELASWEYDWINTAGGDEQTIPGASSYTVVTVPGGFKFYDTSVGQVRLFEDGYLTMPASSAATANNVQIPNANQPNAAIYALWDNLSPDLFGDTAPYANLSHIYTRQDGDWFAIEYNGFVVGPDSPILLNDDFTFQIQINTQTDEVRVLYQQVPAGASDSATIGLENWDGSIASQVAYNQADKAQAGEGYKFLPAPPQPSRTFTTSVDATIDSVGFLLTGFSGDFDPLAIRRPDGSPVGCDEGGVLCIDLDLVQYVQVDVGGRTGAWTAEVSAGPSGSGTFAFSSMALGPLAAHSPDERTRSTDAPGRLGLDLGQPVDGNAASAWFLTPQGQPFGAGFGLHDDGQHGDGQAGDGFFGSDAFAPPGSGSAYLWVGGALNGAAFVRVDPVPFEFRPLGLISLGDVANMGGGSEVRYELANDDAADHCYRFELRLPEGWFYDINTPVSNIECVSAGNTAQISTTVWMTNDFTNDLPSGSSGVVTLSALEVEDEAMVASAGVRVTRHRPPASIAIEALPGFMRPGKESDLTVVAVDEQGYPVADGTQLDLLATLGTATPALLATQDGRAASVFGSGGQEGTALLKAQTGASLAGAIVVSGTAEIVIAAPAANWIGLETSVDRLPPDGSSTATIQATVSDLYGEPVAGQLVRLGIEEDGEEWGTIDGGLTITGTTDAQGRIEATYTSGTEEGEVALRAQILVAEGDGYRVVHDARRTIQAGWFRSYLPLVVR